MEGINGKIAVYRNPEAPLRQLVVPQDEQLDDYTDRIAEAMQRLAEFEKRPVREVLNQLLLPPADVLRFREVSPEAEAGLLPLNHAARMRLQNGVIVACYRALASWCRVPTIHGSQRAHRDGSFRCRACRLGQTERGSFVLTVACPLDLQAGLFGPNGEPFTRRVTVLLMAALQDLSQGIDAARLDALAD